jgi:RNA polymerase sigma factor (sigma-70 family)
MAVKIWYRIGKRIPLDDLKQYGALGLVRAAAIFDASLGFKFKTYADHRIRGAIMDGIRAETRFRTYGDVQLVSLEGKDVPVDMEPAMSAAADISILSRSVKESDKLSINEVYIHEQPQSRVAKKLGVSACMVSVRCRRGLSAMRAAIA